MDSVNIQYRDIVEKILQEDGIAYEMMAAGIPEQDIVLAFKLPELQKLRSLAIS